LKNNSSPASKIALQRILIFKNPPSAPLVISEIYADIVLFNDAKRFCSLCILVVANNSQGSAKMNKTDKKISRPNYFYSIS